MLISPFGPVGMSYKTPLLIDSAMMDIFGHSSGIFNIRFLVVRWILGVINVNNSNIDGRNWGMVYVVITNV